MSQTNNPAAPPNYGKMLCDEIGMLPKLADDYDQRIWDKIVETYAKLRQAQRKPYLKLLAPICGQKSSDNFICTREIGHLYHHADNDGNHWTPIAPTPSDNAQPPDECPHCHRAWKYPKESYLHTRENVRPYCPHKWHSEPAAQPPTGSSSVREPQEDFTPIKINPEALPKPGAASRLSSEASGGQALSNPRLSEKTIEVLAQKIHKADAMLSAWETIPVEDIKTILREAQSETVVGKLDSATSLPS